MTWYILAKLKDPHDLWSQVLSGWVLSSPLTCPVRSTILGSARGRVGMPSTPPPLPPPPFHPPQPTADTFHPKPGQGISYPLFHPLPLGRTGGPIKLGSHSPGSCKISLKRSTICLANNFCKKFNHSSKNIFICTFRVTIYCNFLY